MTIRRVLLATFVLCATSAWAFGQGVQTGAIRGAVHDQQGLPVPGVTVTVTSPSLQGPRSVVTATDGAFTVPALPAGDYTITYELSSFGTVTHSARVPVGLTVEENVKMKAAA